LAKGIIQEPVSKSRYRYWTFCYNAQPYFLYPRTGTT